MVLKYILENIDDIINEHDNLVKTVKTSERYYENKTDITQEFSSISGHIEDRSATSELRKADNKVPHNFHFILTNQEASYAFTKPPSFDVGDKKMNEDVIECIGNEDEFSKESKDLCIDAINSGKAWLHVWIDEATGKFNYASVNPKNVIPIYNQSLKRKLLALIYKYREIKESEKVTVFEIWVENKMYKYFQKDKSENGEKSELIKAEDFEIVDKGTGEVIDTDNEYDNEFSRIPFIEFRNNNIEKPNLDNYKKHIDIYDKVYSGYVNDVEDFQEIILVLTNYGGESLDDFMGNLKAHKIVKVDDAGEGARGGVDKLMIDIPVEARNTLLETTKDLIYESGQGVNPHQEVANTASGVALKQIYSMLELKVGLLETEFKMGFADLIGFILEFKGHNREEVQVKQKWHRTRIDNDLEKADIMAKAGVYTSQEALSKFNPMVDDYLDELNQLKKENHEDHNAENSYRNNNAEENDDLNDQLNNEDSGDEDG